MRCIGSPSSRPTRITTTRARKKTSSDGFSGWAAARALSLASPENAATDSPIIQRAMPLMLDPDGMAATSALPPVVVAADGRGWMLCGSGRRGRSGGRSLATVGARAGQAARHVSGGDGLSHARGPGGVEDARDAEGRGLSAMEALRNGCSIGIHKQAKRVRMALGAYELHGRLPARPRSEEHTSAL